MIKSMTGFGSSTFEDDQVIFAVEIKTLNSKMADINLRLPRFFSDKEVTIRNLLTDILGRGKIMASIEMTVKDPRLSGITANDELFSSYYSELSRLANKVGAKEDDLFRLSIQQPEVFTTRVEEEVIQEQWSKLEGAIRAAAKECDDFRRTEGAVLEPSLVGYISAIRSALTEVKKLDPDRVERIRNRIRDNFASFISEQNIDQNRMEQELLYYIEKLDISEEKVRLESHLDYFEKELGSNESNGKTLGFIGQEIGREINTIGSKANDAAIQQHVVRMKEELEKIKEQVLNIL